GEFLDRLQRTQPTVQRAFDAIGRGRFADLAGSIDDAGRIRIVGPAGAFEGRGEEARRRLIEELSADEALVRGRQVRGDLYPGLPTTAAVLAYDVDGGVANRVVVFTVYDERLAEIAWHRV